MDKKNTLQRVQIKRTLNFKIAFNVKKSALPDSTFITSELLEDGIIFDF